MGLSRAFERIAIEQPIVCSVAMGVVADIVKANVKALYGDASRLNTLAESTQEERSRLGYEPNRPLLREGLLRDSVFSAHAGMVAEVGSNDPVAGYMENGFVNVKAGVSVEPRPAFRYGIEDSEPEIGALFDEVGAVLFGGGMKQMQRLRAVFKRARPT